MVREILIPILDEVALYSTPSYCSPPESGGLKWVFDSVVVERELVEKTSLKNPYWLKPYWYFLAATRPGEKLVRDSSQITGLSLQWVTEC